MSLICTTQPIPNYVQQYYYEATIIEQGETGDIAIGLSKNDPNTWNGRMPGWDDGTIGYHGDDGSICHKTGSAVCETFGNGDTVGCMLYRIYVDNICFLRCHFTKNGENLKPVRYLENGNYHPTIGMNSGTRVTANLGETEFLYTIQGNTTKI